MERVRSGEPGEAWGAGSRREELEASEAGGCFQEEEKRKRERRACTSEKELAKAAMTEDIGTLWDALLPAEASEIGGKLHCVSTHLGIGTVPGASMVLEPAPVSLSH